MKQIEVKFGIGDTVCSRYKAECGVIERMTVEMIKVTARGVEYVVGSPFATIDGHVYTEKVLLTEEEAIEQAIFYHEMKAFGLREDAKKKKQAEFDNAQSDEGWKKERVPDTH